MADSRPNISPPIMVASGLLVAAIVFLLLGEPPQLSFAHVKYVYYGLVLVMPAAIGVVAVGKGVIRRRWSRGQTLAVALAAGLFGAYVWATHIEPFMLQVRTVDIESEAVSEPLSIVHISDIQTPEIGDYEREVFQTIASLDADLVVHTGDVLQPPTPEELSQVARLFRELEPTYGVYNIEGDVDRMLTDSDWAKFDQAADVETLLDASATVETRAGTVRLLGLTGITSRTLTREQTRAWLARTDDAPALDIILGHAPDYILNIRGEPVDLALAGHTHGGQVRVPLYGPPVTLSKVPREWAFGHTVIDGTHLNVTSGIGAERADGVPPIRFNCPPEITLIRVRPRQ